MRKSNMKLLLGAYHAYCNGGRGTLYEAYRCPSVRKQRIWHDIVSAANVRDDMQIDATIPVVISRNTSIFTAAYVSERVNPETGEIQAWFVYITPTTDYEILVLDLVQYELAQLGK